MSWAEIKSGVGSNETGEPDEEVDTSGTSNRAKPTKISAATTSAITPATTPTTTKEEATSAATTPTSTVWFQGRKSNSEAYLEESHNIETDQSFSHLSGTENQRKPPSIDSRLSHDQSNAIEDTFNEIETDSGNKSKLGFIADNYLALRQKHKARSTTTKATTATTTTTTTYRPPRRKTTNGQVSEDLKRKTTNGQVS